MSRLAFKFYNGLKYDDGERAVLPTITYCQEHLDGLTGYVLTIGWWKWHIGIRLITGTAASSSENPVLPYCYYITHASPKHIGWSIVSRNSPISTYEDLLSVKKDLEDRDKERGEIVITNWIRLSPDTKQ